MAVEVELDKSDVVRVALVRVCARLVVLALVVTVGGRETLVEGSSSVMGELSKELESKSFIKVVESSVASGRTRSVVDGKLSD